MAGYPPKKNAALVLYVSLVSQANTKVMQANPTLASGDFKVSIDGGSLADLATLPTVTPAAGVMVKISLSSSEMNGDDITVVCRDAAGSEWCDLVIPIKTSTRQIDDLAYPATSGRSMVVDAAGLVDANAVKVGPTGSGTAQTARDLGASVVAASVTADVGITQAGADKVWGTTTRALTDKAGFALSSAGVQAIWDALTSALTTAGSIGKKLADWVVGTAQTGDSYARLGAPAGASVSADIAAAKADTAAIKAKTDNLPASPAAVGDIPTATANADALLKRDMSAVTGEAARSPLNAIRKLMNRWFISGGLLTVCKEDDVTPAVTQSVSTVASADAITGLDTV